MSNPSAKVAEMVVKHIRTTHRTRRKGNYTGKRGRNILINAIAAVIGCGVVQIILRPVSSILLLCKSGYYVYKE